MKMPLRMALLATLAVGSVLARTCPTFNAASDFLSGAPCEQCTQDNVAALESGDTDLCAWCYNASPEKSCMPYSFSLTGAFSNPCKTEEQPDAAFTLGGENCDCSSPTYDDCKSCTANPKCDWVEGAETQFVFSIDGISTNPISVWTNNTCMQGGPLGPSTKNTTFTYHSVSLTVALKPVQWFCLQCTLENRVFLWVVLGAFFAGLIVLIIGIVCCVRCCNKRRNGGPKANVFSSIGN